MAWFDNLFFEVGRKIKAVAKWVFIVSFFALVIVGVLAMVGSLVDEETVAFVLVIPIGVFVTLCSILFSSWLLYGFGALVEKAENDTMWQQAPAPQYVPDAVPPTVYYTGAPTAPAQTSTKAQVRDGWGCPACYRVNPKYQTTCSCGEKKPQAMGQTKVVKCPQCNAAVVVAKAASLAVCHDCNNTFSLKN